jgi:ADP-ribose pyrophosphatase YjhB (NUDIX family)
VHNDRTWGLPGGNIEHGDGADLRQTALREAAEELGTLPPLRHVDSYLTHRGKEAHPHCITPTTLARLARCSWASTHWQLSCVASSEETTPGEAAAARKTMCLAKHKHAGVLRAARCQLRWRNAVIRQSDATTTFTQRQHRDAHASSVRALGSSGRGALRAREPRAQRQRAGRCTGVHTRPRTRSRSRSGCESLRIISVSTHAAAAAASAARTARTH